VDLLVGNNRVVASYASGSGSPVLTFRYRVVETDQDLDGVEFVSTSIRLAGGSLRDPNGVPVDPAVPVSNLSGVRVRGSAPFVVSVRRFDATPTDAGEVQFEVSFNEPVRNVDAGDFVLRTAAGLSGVAIRGSAETGGVYRVTVSTGSGSGTIELGVRSDATIEDLAGNVLGAGFQGGEVFTVLRGPERRITDFYEKGHGDIGIGYAEERWDLAVHRDEDDQPLDRVLIYGGAEGKVARGGGSDFDFLGVPSGAPIYVWTQNGSNPDVPELGVGGEQIAGGTFAAYANPDSRIQATGPFVRLQMVGFRGPRGGHFSAYETSLDAVKVWFATSDGITEKDALWILEGSHQHFAFAFTAPGIYEVDVVASGYRDSNGNGVYDEGTDPYTESGVQTIYFGVDTDRGPQPYRIAAGMGTRAPGSGASMEGFVFERYDVPGSTETLLADIDNRGGLVGRFRDANGLSQGFTRSGTNLLTFNITGNTATFPGGQNAVGAIAGFYRNATNSEIQHGFIRGADGGVTRIDGEMPGFTYVWRVNDAGQANGYWFENEPFFIRSFRRETNGVLTTLVYPGSPMGTVARGMNDAGVMTGWKWDENFNLQGVVIEGSRFTQVFTVPGWDHTLPGDINNAGEIAGTVNIAFEKTAGFLRSRDGSTVTFAPPGASSVEVFGMNDLGEIVGEYLTSGEQRHGFIARPVPEIGTGHVDLGVEWKDGRLDLHIHVEETDVEYSPRGAVFRIGEAAERSIPDLIAFSFLGTPGHSTWILTTTERDGLPFLGLGTEDIASGVLTGDRLSLELIGITGAGDVALYDVDGFGGVTVLLNSADGVSAQDRMALAAGTHRHVFWAFNAPGTHEVRFRVSGILAEGNVPVTAEGVFTFVVAEPRLPQPEPPDDSVYLLTDLGTFGGSMGMAWGVADDGTVVGMAERSVTEPYVSRAFRVQPPAAIEDLGTLGGDEANARALNATGVITGGALDATGRNRPFRWDKGTMSDLGTLGGDRGEGFGINEAGVVVGWSELVPGASEPFRAFRHGMMGSGMTDLGTLGGKNSMAFAVNSAGGVVGWSLNAAGETRAFRWTESGGMVDLGTLGGDRSFAMDINAAGDVVGRSRLSGNQSSHATLWRGTNAPVDLGSLGGRFSGANAFGPSGDVVGWSTRDGDDDARFGVLWTGGGAARDLNEWLPRGEIWRVTEAFDMNTHQWIVGTAVNSRTGEEHPALLRPAKRLVRGHTDVGLVFEDGKFEFEIHHEEAGGHFAPYAALMNVPARAIGKVPANPGFAFLGEPGAPVWILPQSSNPNLLFLGVAAEDIRPGTFVGDRIEMVLKEVDGPGHFSVFAVGGFGTPEKFLDSRDGITEADVLPLSAGSHSHLNWAFTEPGLYRIRLEGRATLAATGAVMTTVADFQFEVVGASPTLTWVRSGNGVIQLSFRTEEGVSYQLETAPAPSGPWVASGQTFVGTGRTKELTVSTAGGAGFLRIVTAP
jgi:surface-anchored protein